MSNIVDTVEDRIQNAILTAIDNIVAPKIELAIRSINASSGRDVTSVSANSERREHMGINAPIENASENNNTLGVTNVNDETRRNSQDGVSELSVPGTQFGRQSHIHHVLAGGSEQIHNPHHVMTDPSSETHHTSDGKILFVIMLNTVMTLLLPSTIHTIHVVHSWLDFMIWLRRDENLLSVKFQVIIFLFVVQLSQTGCCRTRGIFYNWIVFWDTLSIYHVISFQCVSCFRHLRKRRHMS